MNLVCIVRCDKLNGIWLDVLEREVMGSKTFLMSKIKSVEDTLRLLGVFTDC